MKKILFLCLALGILCCFSACKSAQEATEIQSDYGSYADLIAQLEAGEYDEIRRMIDEMEGIIPVQTSQPTEEQNTPAVQTEAAIPVTEPEVILPEDYEIVELNRYIINDYFKLEEQYYIAELSRYVQYLTLKEEYRNRLIAAENVKLELTYLLTDAYGTIDQKAERFDVEYFDITSGTAQQKTVAVQDSGKQTLFQAEYSAKRGCFRDFPMDTEIVSGSGTLIFSQP